MERHTPVPEPQSLTKFDERIFSDLDDNKSSNFSSELSIGNSTPDKNGSSKRRSKAERMKTKNKKQTEIERENNFIHAKNNDRTGRNKNQQNLCDFDMSKSANSFSKTLKISRQNGNKEAKAAKRKDSKGNSFKSQKNEVDKNKLNKKKYDKSIRFDKTRAAKAEKNRKNHISYLVRNKMQKASIILFAQRVAVAKISNFYKKYIEEKQERERIRFEQAKKRVRKNFARATIRKYVTLHLIKKREQRENLEFHEKYHLDKIKYIQIKYRALKARPKKLNVPRFKQIFHAALLGWKIRRIMSYLQTLPQVREAMDYVKLRNDIDSNRPNDAFSKQIIEKYPEMIVIFQNNFNDLIENAVWIK